MAVRMNSRKNWAGNKEQWNTSMSPAEFQLSRGPRRVSLEFVGADKYSWGPSEWLVRRGYQIRDRMGGLSIMLDRAWVPGSLPGTAMDSFCRGVTEWIRTLRS